MSNIMDKMAEKYEIKYVKLTNEQMNVKCLENLYKNTLHDFENMEKYFESSKQIEMEKQTRFKIKVLEKQGWEGFLTYLYNGFYLFNKERLLWLEICKRNGWNTFLD